MKNGTCPNCKTEIAFGIQRCTTCGVLIYWKGDRSKPKFPEIRSNDLTFPQKAVIYHSCFGRTLQDESSPVVREYFPKERVVVVNMIGDFVALETGGWVNYQFVGIFGRLQKITLIDPTGTTMNINVHSGTHSGETSADYDSVLRMVKPGDTVEVWEHIPGWIRVDAGNGWISSYWFDPKSIKQLR